MIVNLAHRHNAMQRPMKTTEVSKTRFNDWSEIESFPEEDHQTSSPVVQRNEEPGKISTQASNQASNSSITGSALKKIREKRQKQQIMSSPETVERHERSPLSTSTSGVHSAVSFDGSAAVSAVSQSMCSETSHMQSTYASGLSAETPTTTTTTKNNTDSHYPLDVVPDVSEMIPDEFVSEKNASVQSFQSAYERMSLEQIAKDMQEEASSVLKMDFLNNEYLNKGIDAAGKGINAAGMSLHQFVGGDMFQKKSTKTKLPKRAPSPVEEVAIEVEYIADSDDEAYRRR